MSFGVPSYSSITIYVDDAVMDELFAKTVVKVLVAFGSVPIKSGAYIHVHDHGKRHVTAYAYKLSDGGHKSLVNVELHFVMDLTVAT